MLPDELLSEFMGTFFGYGDLSADIWFIGMEEGGGGSVEDINTRLNAWDARGRRSIEDLAEYHHAIGAGDMFEGQPPALQRTWVKLLRALFVFNQGSCNNFEMKLFQRDQLGRLGSGTCLLELMPLPAPSIASAWLYGELSESPELQTRQAYFAAISPKRKSTLAALIRKHRPRNVVFYGKSYFQEWNEIAGEHLVFLKNTTFSEAQDAGTNYFIAKHPIARGTCNEDWDKLGGRMRSASLLDGEDLSPNPHRAK